MPPDAVPGVAETDVQPSVLATVPQQKVIAVLAKFAVTLPFRVTVVWVIDVVAVVVAVGADGGVVVVNVSTSPIIRLPSLSTTE